MKTIGQGNGTAGTRAAPTQAGTNDEKIGLRLDNEEKFVKDGKKYKRYKVQINKNAENATLRELARKNPHKVWSQADMLIEEVPQGKPVEHTEEDSQEKAVEQLFQDLEKDMETE